MLPSPGDVAALALHPWRPGRGVGASPSQAGPRKPVFLHPSEAGPRHWSAPSGGRAVASQHPPRRPGRCISASPWEVGPLLRSIPFGGRAKKVELPLWMWGRGIGALPLEDGSRLRGGGAEEAKLLPATRGGGTQALELPMPWRRGLGFGAPPLGVAQESALGLEAGQTSCDRTAPLPFGL